MRLLMVLPYGPSSTRVRSRMVLRELAARHEVTLLALAWDEADREALAAWCDRGVDVRVIQHGWVERLRGLHGDPRRPLQRIVSTSAPLARQARALLKEGARAGRPFDAVHVEHLRGAAALALDRGLGTRTVFDAVDCIAELARLTRRWSPDRGARLIATIEEGRTRQLEAAYIAAADATTVVAERDLAALLRGGAPARVSVAPNGVAIPATLGPPVNEPVAIFTGKLSYHANEAALRRLLDVIWPRVRAAIPAARLIVAGADPPRWVAEAAGRNGVALVANPAEMAPLIASARAALAPMLYSVGIQNKVLEAMACGVAVVATSSAAQGLLPAADGRFLLADDAAAFADATARLLRDTAGAAALGRAGHDYVRRCHTWAAVADHFEALYAGDRPARAVLSAPFAPSVTKVA